MDYNVLDALTMITREKNIDREIIIESLVAGLQSAAKKKLGLEANIDARVDSDTGDMVVEQVKIVVDEIDDPDVEISLDEAQIEFGDEVEVGDEVRWELPLDQFGRNAILVAKQILVQKVREAERSYIFEEYKDRVNQIIVGTIPDRIQEPIRQPITIRMRQARRARMIPCCSPFSTSFQEWPRATAMQAATAVEKRSGIWTGPFTNTMV